MDKKINIKDILFFDIETVSQQKNFNSLHEDKKKLWKEKSRSILRKPLDEISDTEVEKTYNNRAAIYAEYGKIVCISAGIIRDNTDGEKVLHIKSFYGEDERDILIKFVDVLLKVNILCGHNIKEFDVPYTCRRLLYHQIKLPPVLDVSGKKPWETKHLVDTLHMWRFGDYKNYTGLKVLTNFFGIPSPKDDIDGSQVGNVFWNNDKQNFESGAMRIAAYCEKDVIATTQVFLKLNYLDLLEKTNSDLF